MGESHDALRERLRREARTVAEELRANAETAAVILSGPLALGVVSGEKLYFAVIVDRDDGIIEHHFLDEGRGSVKRPIEMGVFPVTVARHLVENGYRDMVSYKSLEAFRCGEVLWERDGIGTEMVEGSKRHLPDRSFIGESLHGAVSALDDAVSLLRSGDCANAVLVAREAVAKAVGMAIGEAGARAAGAGGEAGDGGSLGVSGEAEVTGVSFLEAARTVLPPEEFAHFLDVMGIDETDEAAARKGARSAREFAEHVLREIGVNPESLLGRTGGGRSS